MADALDVTEVYAAACTAVTYVRERCAPYFLALPTYRLAPHSKGDDTRQRDELAAAWGRDPLERLGRRLHPAERAEVDTAAAARVQQAIAAALAEESLSRAQFAEGARWQPA
jgi:TPP-dependent pyruvate/acetoin dehydrogenase alpha subunit